MVTGTSRGGVHERGSQAVVHVCQARVSPEVSYQGCSLVVDPVDRYCLFESQGLSELMGYQQVEHTGQRDMLCRCKWHKFAS